MNGGNFDQLRTEIRNFLNHQRKQKARQPLVHERETPLAPSSGSFVL